METPNPFGYPRLISAAYLVWWANEESAATPLFRIAYLSWRTLKEPYLPPIFTPNWHEATLFFRLEDAERWREKWRERAGTRATLPRFDGGVNCTSISVMQQAVFGAVIHPDN